MLFGICFNIKTFYVVLWKDKSQPWIVIFFLNTSQQLFLKSKPVVSTNIVIYSYHIVIGWFFFVFLLNCIITYAMLCLFHKTIKKKIIINYKRWLLSNETRSLFWVFIDMVSRYFLIKLGGRGLRIKMSTLFSSRLLFSIMFNYVA